MLKERHSSEPSCPERETHVCRGWPRGVFGFGFLLHKLVFFIFNTVLFYIYYLNTVTILYLALEAKPSTPSLLQIRENRTIFLKLVFCIGLKAVPSIL